MTTQTSKISTTIATNRSAHGPTSGTRPSGLRDGLRPRISVDEAASFAGVSSRTIRRWMALGHFKHAKPNGGKVFIHRDSFMGWLDGDA